jgi:hypothetical protein
VYLSPMALTCTIETVVTAGALFVLKRPFAVESEEETTVTAEAEVVKAA